MNEALERGAAEPGIRAVGRVSSAFLWRLFERGANLLVSLAVQIFLARLLMPEDYGSLAIVSVFVSVAGVFVSAGLGTALVQAEEVDSGSYSTVFWLSLFVGALLYALLFALAPSVGSFYGMPEVASYLRVLGLSLLIGPYTSVQSAMVTRSLQLRKTFVPTLLAGALSGAAGVAAASAGWGTWALVVQSLVSSVSYSASLAWWVRWLPSAVFRPAEARRLFSFGWKLLASSLLDTGYSSLSDLVVGKEFSAADLGVMNRGKGYPLTLVSIVDGAIQPVALSSISRLSGDADAARALTRKALRSSCYFVAPVLALLASVAPALVPWLLGEQWAAAVPYMQVFCVTFSLWPVHTTNLNALNAMGRSDLFLRLEIIKKAYGVANLLFCAFVLRDVWLLCCSYLITGVVSTFVNASPNKRVLGYGYLDQVRDILPGFGLSAVAAAAALAAGLAPLPPVPLMLLQSAAFAAVYLGLSRLLHVEELDWALGIARGLLGRARGAE